METSSRLNTFDLLGVSILTLLGACTGLGISMASDIKFTAALALICPGVLVGVPVWWTFGRVAGVLTTAIANGLAYGLGLYLWHRLLIAFAGKIPSWFRIAGLRLAQHSEKGSQRR